MFYDLFGIISLFSFQVKLTFKSLCTENLSWNAAMPLHYPVRWKKLLNNLLKLQTILVDKDLFSNPVTERNIELHGFCDSSSKFYSKLYTYPKFRNQI